LLLIGFALFQRKLLYLPSHHKENNGLTEWRHEGQIIGYARHARSPETVWLFLHGNAGQAADRTYILPSVPIQDSVYILEYPGYGNRQGSPSLISFNTAAKEAYELLKNQFPNRPVCIAAASIGTGPASYLATIPNPPEKIVLITPFDRLSKVAAGHYPFLPVSLLLRDNWDNIASLKDYNGHIEIFGARTDTIIPISHAKKLADSKPSAVFHTVEGGHNDWADSGSVKLQYIRHAIK
jgi:pimeloyl-ACP methyl ester carboxylesterase